MKQEDKHKKLIEKRNQLLNELNSVEKELAEQKNEGFLFTSGIFDVLVASCGKLDGQAFFIVDEQNRVVFTNEAMIHYLGQHGLPTDVMNVSILEVIPLVDTWLANQYDYIRKKQQPFSVEKLLRIGNYNYLAQFDFSPVVTATGTYIINKIINKTGVYDSEKHASLLATILDHTDDHATIKDLNLRIIGANKALVKSAGKKDISEVLGKTDLELFGEYEHVKQYMKDDREAQNLKAGQYLEREEYYIFSDGKITDTLVRKFPVFDNQGELIGTANISRNISQIKQAEKKLRKSEEKYRTLIENQGEGACIIDKLGTFVFTNIAAQNIFDVAEGKLDGQSIKDFLQPKDYEIIDNQIHENFSGKRHAYELEIVSKKGLTKYLILTATPYREHAGNQEGSFILFRDITERRRAEKALLDSERELIDLNATKDKFFSIIGHDLKNPFGSIMGFAELIERKAKQNDAEKVIRYAHIIYQASKHGFELLENLLNWSRSQNGTLKYQPGRVLLHELIQHNIEVTGEIANKKEISMQWEVDKDIVVFCDEDMVNTVLRNLITNAIKFSPRSTCIIISASVEDEFFVRVTVTDQGRGIRKADQERLFKIECSESEKGTEGEEGTGLGLILCKEFIEKNKGEIWVESEYEKGSNFIFTLPLFKADSHTLKD